MMFFYKTAKFAPVWSTSLKIPEIFVQQSLTEYAPGLKVCRQTLPFLCAGLSVKSVVFTKGIAT